MGSYPNIDAARPATVPEAVAELVKSRFALRAPGKGGNTLAVDGDKLTVTAPEGIQREAAKFINGAKWFLIWDPTCYKQARRSVTPVLTTS